MLAALKKLDREPDANNYELFIINGTANGVKGFMPLNRSAGFIFTGNQSAAEVQQTIAHELGHGAFGLEHVGTAAGKTATDNLMDYTASTALDKPQWDLIHGEHRRLTWFQGEEEGMYWGDEDYIQFTIAKIKASFLSNKLINRDSLPAPRNSVRSENVVIGNTTYKYIDVQIISRVGKINSRNIEQVNLPYKGEGLYIDESIYIFVPSDQLQSLKTHITDTRKGLTIFSSGWDANRWSSVLGVVDYGDSRASMYISQVLGSNAAKSFLELRTEIVQNISFYTDLDAMAVNVVHPNAATFGDEQDYWGGSSAIGTKFINAINVGQAIYANGSYPTTTASTDGGFSIRVSGGRDCGKDILDKIKQGVISIDKTTPIDVVSHSMGYAYSLGIIDVLQKAGYKIGWFYCLAPENAGAGYVPQNIEGIWQYGADEKAENLKTQDLIAPQEAIPGNVANRSFFPENELKELKCVEIHKVNNYGWIFKYDEKKGGIIKRNK